MATAKSKKSEPKLTIIDEHTFVLTSAGDLTTSLTTNRSPLSPGLVNTARSMSRANLEVLTPAQRREALKYIVKRDFGIDLPAPLTKAAPATLPNGATK